MLTISMYTKIDIFINSQQSCIYEKKVPPKNLGNVKKNFHGIKSKMVLHGFCHNSTSYCNGSMLPSTTHYDLQQQKIKKGMQLTSVSPLFKHNKTNKYTCLVQWQPDEIVSLQLYLLSCFIGVVKQLVNYDFDGNYLF